MKKWISLMLVFSLLMGLVSVASAEEQLTVETQELRVGVTTRIGGHFFTERWGANTSDIDIRELIHGLNTVSWEQDGHHVLNQTVVQKLAASVDENGDQVYTISINPGLSYNDGTPINANDYAFSVLLQSSPQFDALGSTPIGMDYIVGYEDYQQGKPFAGVRVMDDETFQLTINQAYLPNYYEITMLNVVPYPIHVLAPDCAVKDDGEGAYIDGPFTEELLQQTIIGDGEGYLYKPYVTAGAYQYVSYDPDTSIAEFAKNEHFAGNFKGVKPTIDKITMQYIPAEQALDAVLNGELDVVNKISDGSIIERGTQLALDGKISKLDYMRTGLSFIAFACEMNPTQSVNVRKALAHCVDVNAVNYEFTGGYGVPVYGYYGVGQWMVARSQDDLAQYAYTLDPNLAIELLVADGWTLNEVGEPYDDENGGIRHKLMDGQLVKLSLKWAQSEGTAMSDVLSKNMIDYAQSAGIELLIEKLPFDELLKHYYRQVDREYNMFSLATNFNLAYDPYPTFHTGDAYQGEANKTGLQDEELMNLALDMISTKVNDDEAYVQKWLAFQARWNEMQPMIPLYSNIYFDFFRNDLQNYHSNAYVSWATAVVDAYIGEPAVVEDVEAGEAVEEAVEESLDY
ncbi:ABC transporter substrate-binding protein [Eubacteriales bacterium OttesenSCG-928-N13]|nr:ABC transporter substrate-binding protein [Eubacteriales bacterium OttesenSCG-928-N13]